MKHPLIKNPAILIWYVLFWIIFSTVQFFFEYNVYNLSIAITLVDVIISNAIYMLLGLGMWYVVIGANGPDKGQLYIVFYHLFAMLFIVSFWMWLTNQIDIILFDQDSVKEHMKNIMPGKAGRAGAISATDFPRARGGRA